MKRKLLAASLFTVCIATTALTPAYSFANEDSVYFYPKQKWVIEQVGGASDDKLKSCALINKLNNGYIVQIAGNSEGFTNLNIDFRQDIFGLNEGYEVKYSIPGISESLIPAKAFRESLLVSDLRGDANFADYLRSTSVLDVQVKDAGFRIYMTGIAAAMGAYDDCVGFSKGAGVGGDSDISLAAKDSAIGADMAVPSYAAPIQLKNVDLAPPPPQKNPVIEVGGSEEMLQLSLQGDVLPEHKLRPSPSSEPRYTEIVAQQLKKESEKYKPEMVPQIVEEAAQIDEVVEPEASAMHVGEEMGVDASSVIVAAAVVAVMDEAAESLAGIEPTVGRSDEGVSVDVLSISGEADLGVSELAAMHDKISELENEVEALLNKNRMLDEELTATLRDAEKERLSVSSSNWDLESATMKFNEAERQIMRLGRKLQAQEAQCQHEKAELENMLFDPELTNQNQLANLSLLEEEVASVKADLYRQQRQYEERIKLLEEQLDAQ